ncbi:MAG: hypothetical protein F6K50_28665 [Moorea sp. SIO3I7]|nr:hypothetical protein [Moorena sp. SIO3I7]
MNDLPVVISAIATSASGLSFVNCCQPSILTLPPLKRRGFLDLRPALNLRVQVSNSVRSLAISKLKSRQDQDSSSVHERPSGLVSLGV